MEDIIEQKQLSDTIGFIVFPLRTQNRVDFTGEYAERNKHTI